MYESIQIRKAKNGFIISPQPDWSLAENQIRGAAVGLGERDIICVDASAVIGEISALLLEPPQTSEQLKEHEALYEAAKRTATHEKTQSLPPESEGEEVETVFESNFSVSAAELQAAYQAPNGSDQQD